jgi:putative ABC transport system permease protein
MFKNYLKIALRNSLRHKGFTAINIVGLALGMTCFLLIMRHIQQELEYDAFHERADRIYRIAVESKKPAGNRFNASTPYPAAPALRLEYSEFVKLARVFFYGESLIEADGKKIYEKKIVFAEPEFFEIFSFPLLRGNALTALAQPHSIVLTASTARKYFGDGDPMGKTVRLDDRFDFAVTGVVADPLATSHFHFDFLASFANVNEEIVGFDPEQWGAFFGIYTYALVSPQENVARLEERLAPFYDKHAAGQSNESRRLFLQPLRKIHLHSQFESEIEPNNSITNLAVLGTLALLVLLIACINFINLSTARSARRAKEVGLRKVLGAERPQLVKQFLGESLLHCAVALALSFGLVELLLPKFSDLIGKSIEFSFAKNALAILGIAGLALLVGVAAGIYPAFVLSAFQPAESLKGIKAGRRAGKGAFALRRILVVAQFAISVVLITSTLIIREQLRFVKQADLGFDGELTLVIPLRDEAVRKKYQVIKNEFSKNPNVRAAIACLAAPVGENEFNTALYPRGRADAQRFDIRLNFVDYNFLEGFGLNLLAGRNFSPQISTDSMQAFIINEATVKQMGLRAPEEAIGKKVTIGVNDIEGTIIGVTKDFHHQSMHEAISPEVMMYWPRWFYEISVKIAPQDISGTLAFLEKSWQRLVPGFPFQYQFLDDYVASLYLAEEKTERTVEIFSALAICIAGLGLFGLAAFAAEQRTKEVGIRKVLGASVAGVLALLSKDFVKLVFVANLFAWPMAWYAMNRWLQNFAYRIEIGWWIFALAGLGALAVALLTVSTQAIKAALANPVESLRYE